MHYDLKMKPPPRLLSWGETENFRWRNLTGYVCHWDWIAETILSLVASCHSAYILCAVRSGVHLLHACAIKMPSHCGQNLLKLRAKASLSFLKLFCDNFCYSNKRSNCNNRKLHERTGSIKGDLSKGATGVKSAVPRRHTTTAMRILTYQTVHIQIWKFYTVMLGSLVCF